MDATQVQDTLMEGVTSSAVTEEPSTFMDGPLPTARELELLRLLKLKEAEVEDLTSTLALLTSNPLARPPPLPLPPAPLASPPVDPSAPEAFVIPRALLPVLAHLRAHSLALARENAELLAVVAPPPLGGECAAEGLTKRKVDLKAVVERLRSLSAENEELEGVVDALGREVEEGRGLKQALGEAHETIVALDGDLERSFGQIEVLQALVREYEGRYGPLPATGR